MICQWKELLSILPQWLSAETDIIGRERLQELRLRQGQPPELVCSDGSRWLHRPISAQDLLFCINAASKYSPWTAQTLSQGYVTAPGGHRIGICGEAAMHNGSISTIRSPTSLCIRVARDFPGCGEKSAQLDGSILLIGPPGSGKTTLLRDMIRCIAKKESVAVVDERGELFPSGFRAGNIRLDVLNGCPKRVGIDMVLRTMGPSCIAVDEITAEEDCSALIQAGWCGVRLLATAHAASVCDLRKRVLYRPLLETKLFDHVIALRRDKSWREERIDL